VLSRQNPEENTFARVQGLVRRVVGLVAASTVALGGSAGGGVGAAPGVIPTSLTAWTADVNGIVAPIGNAPAGGDLHAIKLQMPVIAIAGRPGTTGYWMASLDGGVFAFGGAPFLGSLGARPLNQPVVNIAPTPTGRGYWLVASDGGVFSFGDARFFGSLGSTPLNRPIVAMSSTATGHGYWLLASDGGVFAFGDARFFGSLGGERIAAPIATFAVSPRGRGYWLVDRTGRVRAFGDATPWGDANVGAALAVGIAPTKDANGYWIASSDGDVRAFGDAGPGASQAHLAGSTVGIATPWASSSGLALPLLEFLRTLARARSRQQIRTWVGPDEVALTFDDGPSQYTLGVLAALERLGVQATFFAVGTEVVSHPELVRAEADAGMAVGDHTWDHADLTHLSPAEITAELQRGSDAIAAATRRSPLCFRPPYGDTSPTIVSQAARLGLTQILWNVDPSDYLRPGTSTIVSRVLATANGRGLVVAIHDGGGDRSQTVAALPAIVFGLRARGYTFVRLC